MKSVLLVYNTEQFEDEELYKELEKVGFDVENVLFADAEPIEFSIAGSFRRFRQFMNTDDKIPEDVLKQIKGDPDYLCFHANSGRGAGDGIFENPHQGQATLIYDANLLTPFLTENGRKYKFRKLEDTGTFYAKSAKKLQEAIIGVIKFV